MHCETYTSHLLSSVISLSGVTVFLTFWPTVNKHDVAVPFSVCWFVHPMLQALGLNFLARGRKRHSKSGCSFCGLGRFFVFWPFVFRLYAAFFLFLVVSTSANDGLERLISKMTCYVLSGTLNRTHSLTNLFSLVICSHTCFTSVYILQFSILFRSI